MKELIETPGFKGMLKLGAVLTVLAFLDDVIMSVAFIIDGDYWAAAGRIGVFVFVGGAIGILWSSMLRHLGEVKETAEGMAEAERLEFCEVHGLGKSPALGDVCMGCRFAKLDEAANRSLERDRHLRERVEALERPRTPRAPGGQ